MTVNFTTCESPAGTLHLVVESGVVACGRKRAGWQYVIARRMRAKPYCKMCLRVVQRLAASSRGQAVPSD